MAKKCFVCGKTVKFADSGASTADKKTICGDDLNKLFNKPKGKGVSFKATQWASQHSSDEINYLLTNHKIVSDEGKNANNKWYQNKTIIAAIIIVSVLIIGGMAAGGSSDSSSSDAKSEQASKKKDSESEKVEKEKVKNTCDAINQQIAQHEELDGFKLKPAGDGTQFTVEVPATATALSDNEQKSVYQSMLKLIYSYDNGTNEGTMVEFQDQMGNMVARSSYLGDGSIKLTK